MAIMTISQRVDKWNRENLGKHQRAYCRGLSRPDSLTDVETEAFIAAARLLGREASRWKHDTGDLINLLKIDPKTDGQNYVRTWRSIASWAGMPYPCENNTTLPIDL